MNQLRDTLRREIDDLQRLRDELRVQAHLGKAEAQEAWNRLETLWGDVQVKFDELQEASGNAINQVGEQTKALIGEIKTGYTRLRDKN